jgi:hypothetical protein
MHTHSWHPSRGEPPRLCYMHQTCMLDITETNDEARPGWAIGLRKMYLNIKKLWAPIWAGPYIVTHVTFCPEPTLATATAAPATRQGHPWAVRAVWPHRASKFRGLIKILDIYMYFNNKIYCFVRNMGQNVYYSSQKHQTWAVHVVHLCSCMYLNQHIKRDDTFKL